MHGKPLVSSPCRIPLIWIYVYIIKYFLSVAFVPSAARSAPFMGYRGKLAIPRRDHIPHGWCWFPHVIITEYPPLHVFAQYMYIYIYTPFLNIWKARFALAIVNLAYLDDTINPSVGTIHSFVNLWVYAHLLYVLSATLQSVRAWNVHRMCNQRKAWWCDCPSIMADRDAAVTPFSAHPCAGLCCTAPWWRNLPRQHSELSDQTWYFPSPESCQTLWRVQIPAITRALWDRHLRGRTDKKVSWGQPSAGLRATLVTYLEFIHIY